MKTMKRFAARICALFVVLTVSLTALVPAAFAATKAQLPDLPSSQCVVDDANILSSSTKTAIENLNAQLTQQCEGAQIGVLTVDYTGSLSTEDYAVQAANRALAATRSGQALGTRGMTDLLLAIQTQAAAQNALAQARHR
mgnify:CR=1 FL=1